MTTDHVDGWVPALDDISNLVALLGKGLQPSGESTTTASSGAQTPVSDAGGLQRAPWSYNWAGPCRAASGLARCSASALPEYSTSLAPDYYTGFASDYTGHASCGPTQGHPHEWLLAEGLTPLRVQSVYDFQSRFLAHLREWLRVQNLAPFQDPIAGALARQGRGPRAARCKSPNWAEPRAFVDVGRCSTGGWGFPKGLDHGARGRGLTDEETSCSDGRSCTASDSSTTTSLSDDGLVAEGGETPQQRGERMSVGGEQHPHGCTPCAFHCFKLSGCAAGKDCRFCHMSHTSGAQLRRDKWRQRHLRPRKVTLTSDEPAQTL